MVAVDGCNVVRRSQLHLVHIVVLCLTLTGLDAFEICALHSFCQEQMRLAVGGFIGVRYQPGLPDSKSQLCVNLHL